MNDRYLYRARRTDNGEWAEGYYAVIGEKVVIIQKRGEEFYDIEGEKKSHGNKIVEVAPSTICQCTGLKDKNGKLIFENDIVRDDKGNSYKAFWRDRYYQFSWICVKSDKLPIGAKWDFWSIRNYEIEVIGSAIDNPELLEVGE